MNDRWLRIYLTDHLALLVGESELAARCRRSNSRTTLGEFLLRLDMELKAQHSIVSGVLRRVGGSASRTKETAAWLAEKAGRLKLNGTLLTYSDLSRVVELEALAAGSQMRVHLWETLEEVAKRDTRLEGISCSFFLEQARQHLAEINRLRQRASLDAFANG